MSFINRKISFSGKHVACSMFRHCLVMASTASLAFSADASLVLYGTRVIFPAGQAEVTLKISNEGHRPSLVQAWVDKGDDASQKPGADDVPFVIAPSLARMEAGGQQVLRILHSGQALPADRESLFWINVLDIPPKNDPQAEEESSGALSLAFHTRIKLMYRPKGLPGKAAEAAAQLQWSIASDDSGLAVLRARNPSAYVVNLSYLSLRVGDTSYEADSSPVLPGQAASFRLGKSAEGKSLPGQLPPGTAVVYTSLDDWGSVKEHEAELTQ